MFSQFVVTRIENYVLEGFENYVLEGFGSIPALALVYVIMTRGQISHKLWRDTQFGMPLSSPTYCDSL